MKEVKIKLLTPVVSENAKGESKHFGVGDEDTFDETMLAKFDMLGVKYEKISGAVKEKAGV